MCTCFISVSLFLSFSDFLASHENELSGQQSLRVVSWLIKALMFHRIAFEHETLNCSLLVPAIALLWIETRSFCGSLRSVKPHVYFDNTWWIVVKFGNVCTKLYEVKEVFVYICLLNIILHEPWITYYFITYLKNGSAHKSSVCPMMCWYLVLIFIILTLN